jgi:allophanate hydrolase subunit 1
LRQARCPKDATLASVTLLPKVRTFRTSETNCSSGALNVGVADAATATVGVAGADEAGGWGLLGRPQAVSPATMAAAAMSGGTARRVKA